MLVPGRPAPPLSRLLPSLQAPVGAERGETLVLTSGSVSGSEIAGVLGEGRRRGNIRVLVIGSLGVHPDAASPRLRDLWALEEACRASGLPVMALRFGPLLGASSPLWRRLRSRPALGRYAGVLLCPMAETDAALALHRAVELEWNGTEWYDVAGPEIWSLAELAELARGVGERLRAGAGDWEPALEELAEARLPEPSAWRQRSALAPSAIGALAASWS